jgi:hypothetical protein
LRLGRDETDDNETFVRVLRDDDEVFKSLTLLESEAEVVNGEGTVTSEGRVGDECLDAGRDEGEDNVGFVKGRDRPGKDGTDVDVFDLGRSVLHASVRGRRVVDLTNRGDDAGIRSVNVDETNGDNLADAEETSEVGGETLSARGEGGNVSRLR